MLGMCGRRFAASAEMGAGDTAQNATTEVFIKDEALARRLSDTAIRFAVTEADIIEYCAQESPRGTVPV
jgi:hypothetical protein